MRNIHRRVSDLEAAAPPGGCRDEWHNTEAARLAVIYEDMATGETPSPPCCPSCGGLPETVISIVYEKAWRRLNDTPISRTTIEW